MNLNSITFNLFKESGHEIMLGFTSQVTEFLQTVKIKLIFGILCQSKVGFIPKTIVFNCHRPSEVGYRQRIKMLWMTDRCLDIAKVKETQTPMMLSESSHYSLHEKSGSNQMLVFKAS